MIRSTLAALLSSLLVPGLAMCLTQAPDPHPPTGTASAKAPAPSAAAAAEAATAQEQPPAAAAAPVTDADKAAADESPGQKRRDALVAALQPPDGEWLVDDQGRSYFIRLHPKSVAYQMLPNARVRIIYGGEFDLAGQDEENLWLKVYRLDAKPSAHVAPQMAPSAAELAASAATFETPTPASDRLRLKPFDKGLPTRGLWRNGFDLADMNGDGELDFVHGPTRRGGDQPRLFAGDGHGTWRPLAAAVPPGVLDYGDVKVADFNGDGKPDLAFASHLRGISVFVNEGDGKFTSWGKGLDFDTPGQGYKGTGFSSRRIEVLDWNKDGRPDLLALSEGPRIAVADSGKEAKVTGVNLKPELFGPKIYINKGDGSWAALAENGAPHEIFGDDVAVADFDGNGSPDFVISSNDMGREDLLYLQGKVKGGPWSSVDLPLRPRAYVNAVAVGDFNRDRRPDIALTYTSFELGVTRVGVDVYLAGKAGQWERRPVFAREGRVGLSALDVGDLDGDKQLDLVATDHDGYFELFLGDGKGGFSREASPEAQQPRGRCRGYGLRMADVDHDGKAEIFATYAGEANVLFDPERCPDGGGVAAWTSEPIK